MALLDQSARREFLASHPGWDLSAETITRTFRFRDFAGAIGFVASVGVLAEKAFHHPDIDIRYSRVKVSLTTHDRGGLTHKDTSLAARIDRLTAGA